MFKNSDQNVICLADFLKSSGIKVNIPFRYDKAIQCLDFPVKDIPDLYNLLYKYFSYNNKPVYFGMTVKIQVKEGQTISVCEIRLADVLDPEIFYYENNKAELLKQYEGQTLVIKNKAVIGAYADFQDALAKTLSQGHALGTFMVKKCLTVEETVNIY